MFYNFIFNQICITLEKHNVFYIVVNNVIKADTKQLEIYLDCFGGVTLKYKNKTKYFHPRHLTDFFAYLINIIKEEKRE